MPEVEEGDWVVVHVGFAISEIDEEEARRTLEFLEEMEDLDGLEIEAEVEEGRFPHGGAPGAGPAVPGPGGMASGGPGPGPAAGPGGEDR